MWYAGNKTSHVSTFSTMLFTTANSTQMKTRQSKPANTMAKFSEFSYAIFITLCSSSCHDNPEQGQGDVLDSHLDWNIRFLPPLSLSPEKPLNRLHHGFSKEKLHVYYCSYNCDRIWENPTFWRFSIKNWEFAIVSIWITSMSTYDCTVSELQCFVMQP